MNISEILFFKYREALDTDLIRLQDDGDGPYIAYWDESLGKQPDLETIKSWEPDANIQHQISIINSSILKQLQDLDSRTIRALREGNQDRIKQLETEAVELRKGLIK